MKKILIVASSYFFIRTFLIPHIRYWVENGWMVHVASENDGTTIPYAHRQIDIPIKRTPLHMSNLTAVCRLRQLMNEERYDIVNCHTPIGAMVARMAASQSRRRYGTKVVYMTHGLHFYNGAKKKNWMLYCPAEMFLASYTDAIISINEEDRLHIEKYFPQIPYQYKLPGIGYDTRHIGALGLQDRDALRRKYSLQSDDFVLLYIARYTADKNHRFLIKSLVDIQRKIERCKIVMVGDGEEMVACRKLARDLNVDDSVIFAGFQLNITDYLQMADVGVSPSVSEGLGLGIVEEMYASLPILASRVRGHRDLINHGENGLLFTLNDKYDFIEKLIYLYNNPSFRINMGRTAHIGVEKYSIENVIPQLVNIFEELMNAY